MKKNVLILLLLIITINVYGQSYLGVYRNNTMATWNIYQNGSDIIMENYTSSAFGGNIYTVSEERKSEKKYILNTGTSTKYLLSLEDDIWYLSKQYPNGKILKPNEYIQVSGPVSNDKLAEIKKESELFTTITITDSGYYYSSDRKFYYIFPNYDKFTIIKYELDSLFRIHEIGEYEVVFNDEIPYIKFDNEVILFSEFHKSLERFGWEDKRIYDENDSIADAIYSFDSIEVIRRKGIDDEYIQSLENSYLIASRIDNWIIEKNTDQIIDNVPRYGDGYNGFDIIDFITSIDYDYPSDHVIVKIEMVRYNTGTEIKTKDLLLNINYKLND